MSPWAALLGACAAGTVLALVLHEGAHLLVARLLGGTELRLRWRGLTAQVEATLADARRALAFTLAGPAANVVAGIALVVVPLDAPLDDLHDPARVVGLVNLLLALSALVPTGTSDGARALALWRALERAGRPMCSPRAPDRGDAEASSSCSEHRRGRSAPLARRPPCASSDSSPP